MSQPTASPVRIAALVAARNTTAAIAATQDLLAHPVPQGGVNYRKQAAAVAHERARMAEVAAGIRQEMDDVQARAFAAESRGDQRTAERLYRVLDGLEDRASKAEALAEGRGTRR
jgi:hypothetical protein